LLGPAFGPIMMINLFSVRRFTRDLDTTRYISRFVLFRLFVLFRCAFILATECYWRFGKGELFKVLVGPLRDHAPLDSLPTLAEIGGYLLLLSARAPYMLLFEYAGTYFIVSLIIYRAYSFNTDTVYSLFVTRKTHTLFRASLRFLSLLISNSK
jgi:hypothetical protein